MANLADLKPDTRNARKHTPRNVGMIESSLQRDGFGRSILLANDGTIIAGNATIDAAAQAGIEDVLIVESDGTRVIAVKRTDVEPDSERFHKLAIADNRSAELAEWDEAVLAGLNDELDMSGLFWTDEEFAKLTGNVLQAGLTDPDDVPAVVEPITKPGDLWLLGRHRLLCGDSTVATDVERLLGGSTPLLMVTDPPYGVDYEPDWRNDAVQAGVGNGPPGGRAIGRVTNDTCADWRDAWVLSPSVVVYTWHAGLHAATTAASLEESGYNIHSQIIWVKNHIAISRSWYHWQHDPCWFAVKVGATAHWIGDRKQATTWEIDKPQKSETGHSTQKPVECMARPIRNHEGDVYDPFIGSGTTMIAAEQLNRTCYGVEIDPHYCDVIVTRWQNFTGQTATLESTPLEMAAD